MIRSFSSACQRQYGPDQSADPKNKTRIESVHEWGLWNPRVRCEGRAAADHHASSQPRAVAMAALQLVNTAFWKAAVSCHLHSLLEQQPCSAQLGGNELTKWHPFHPSIVPYFNRTLSSKHPSSASIYHLFIRTAPHVACESPAIGKTKTPFCF